MKTACGNCGSKTSCGCSTQNPYEGIEAVWHDPTSYAVTKHGPSFLPGRAKLASAQKAEVQAFVKQAGVGIPDDPTGSPLGTTLNFMRALAHIHQTHHWLTFGPNFLADHNLFERLYTESLDFIDQVAERTVGSGGGPAVDPLLQAQGVLSIVAFVCGHLESDPSPSSLESATPDLMVQRSLIGETAFLKLLTLMLSRLEASGAATPGIRNLLEGVADKHETFVYLLRQRATPYSYDRS